MASPWPKPSSADDLAASMRSFAKYSGLILVVFMLTLWATKQLSPNIEMQNIPQIEECVKSKSLLGDRSANADAQQIIGACAQMVSIQVSINDFELRRVAVFQQYYSNPVLLWMVVIITLAGVVLAGIQLIATFQLAAGSGGQLEQGGRIELDRGKFAIQSSVTGLLILAISFAFFFVFIRYVYLIDYTNIDQKTSAGDRQAAPPKPGNAASPASK